MAGIARTRVAKHGQISPSAETATRTCQNNHSRRVIGSCAPQSFHKRATKFDIQRIQTLRTIQAQNQHRAIAFVEYKWSAHRLFDRTGNGGFVQFPIRFRTAASFLK